MDEGADTDDGNGPCVTCEMDEPMGECTDSLRVCGHHSNESWTQDECFWCGQSFEEAQ